MYLGVPVAGQPPKRLVGFQKVFVEPGASTAGDDHHRPGGDEPPVRRLGLLHPGLRDQAGGLHRLRGQLGRRHAARADPDHRLSSWRRPRRSRDRGRSPVAGAGRTAGCRPPRRRCSPWISRARSPSPLNGALTALRVARLDIVGVVTLGMITALGRRHHPGRPARQPAAGHVQRLALPGRGRGRRSGRLRLRPPAGTADRPITVMDAAGLSLFAVTGAVKALELGLGPGPGGHPRRDHRRGRRHAARRPGPADPVGAAAAGSTPSLRWSVPPRPSCVTELGVYARRRRSPRRRCASASACSGVHFDLDAPMPPAAGDPGSDDD